MDHCHHPSQHEPHRQQPIRLTSSATLHCLSGCAIGELAGLMIGTSLGWGPWPTMGLAVLLGFVSGFSLSLIPLLRAGLSLGAAWRSIWLGETISIAVMELAMNTADYHVGGVTAGSILHVQFWLGYGAALVAGFVAAWPINFILLRRNLKSCH